MRSLQLVCLILFFGVSSFAQPVFQKDTIKTSKGPLVITFVGHASLVFEWNGEVIHLDPSSREADYSKLPKATKIFVTHQHSDHCDPASLKAITTDKTKTFMSAMAHEKWGQGMVLHNDHQLDIDGLKIEVLPAYNLVHVRDNGKPFHPKGEGNSYILTLGDKRIYIGGDTENTPEMKAMKNIDIAFLPMNLPYTMTPEMVADAAKAFNPKVLYPYHYGQTDLNHFLDLMKDEKKVEVRIRRM